jgi:hypothetical protein
MKEPQEPVIITSEPALAIMLHLDSLKKEYERIVSVLNGWENKPTLNEENKSALELIKLKMHQCEYGLKFINEMMSCALLQDEPDQIEMFRFDEE